MAERPYVSPQIMGDGAILSSRQITYIKGDKDFSGFHVEFKDGLGIQQSGDYAAQRYKTIKKGYNTREKEEVFYILFDRSNDFMFIKGPDYAGRLINSYNGKRLYDLQIKDHADPFKALCELSELRKGAYEAFIEKGLFQRLGVINPLLSVLDIATGYVAPSNSFWHKFFFCVPFGLSLIVFDGGDILPVGSSALVFLVLYIISSMGMLVKTDMEARSSLFWIIQCVFYALTMVSIFNVFYPSFDVAYGMQAFGYSEAFQEIIGPYYDSFIDSSGPTSGWLVGVLLIILISRQFIEKNYDLSNILLMVFLGIGAATLCDELLIMLLIGYFFSEIISNRYRRLSREVNARMAAGTGSSLSQAIIITLGSMLIMLIPLVSVLLIGISISYMDSITPMKAIIYAGIPSVIAILVFILDRN